MQTKAILNDDIGQLLVSTSDQLRMLKNICDTMQLLIEHEATLERTDEVYTDEFCDYLYSNNGLKEKCGDELIILRKHIDKAKRIEVDDYDNKIELIMQKKRDDNLLLMIGGDLSNELCVINEETYYKARQYQMRFMVYEDEFYELAKISYKNLYFRESIKDSIKTLYSSFVDMRELIAIHLAAIDDSYELFCNNIHIGYVRMAALFFNATGIECSPQAKRNRMGDCKFWFSANDGEFVEVNCELHTKLKYKGMNHDKQDRIYFSPPIEGISDKKILIAYIGKHL